MRVHEKAIRYDWKERRRRKASASGRPKALENVTLALALLLRRLERGENRLVEHVLQAFLNGSRSVEKI